MQVPDMQWPSTMQGSPASQTSPSASGSEWQTPSMQTAVVQGDDEQTLLGVPQLLTSSSNEVLATHVPLTHDSSSQQLASAEQTPPGTQSTHAPSTQVPFEPQVTPFAAFMDTQPATGSQ